MEGVTGGGYLGGDPHPAFGLPIGSSVAQSTALPSLGTAWHSANPLKASLRPLEEGTVQSPQGKLLNS